MGKEKENTGRERAEASASGFVGAHLNRLWNLSHPEIRNSLIDCMGLEVTEHSMFWEFIPPNSWSPGRGGGASTKSQGINFTSGEYSVFLIISDTRLYLPFLEGVLHNFFVLSEELETSNSPRLPVPESHLLILLMRLSLFGVICPSLVGCW